MDDIGVYTDRKSSFNFEDKVLSITKINFIRMIYTDKTRPRNREFLCTLAVLSINSIGNYFMYIVILVFLWAQQIMNNCVDYLCCVRERVFL